MEWRGMHYRKAGDLMRLLKKSGFVEKNIKIFVEPQRIHVIAVAQKNSHV